MVIMSQQIVYAEDVNYWKTSKSNADTWMERAKKEIRAIDGSILSEAYGSDGGRAAFMLAFELHDDQYKILWPVLQSRKGDLSAAKVQAATMLYYDVKNRCVSMKVLGARAAFFGFLLLPDGRTVAQVGTQELAAMVPNMLTAGN
jgi:hypothetical protein